MANLFVNIPVPAANGSGAPVAMGAFGLVKTVSVTGPFVAAVTIEISNELAPTKWAPLQTFNNADGFTYEVACRWMRATVANYKSGAPACDVGGTDDGTLFASLPVTAGDGVGAAVDVSLLGLFKTVTVGGPFGGNVQLEVSVDGITRWSQIGLGFPNAGQQSTTVSAKFMRVVRAGVPTVAPGLPIVDVAACQIGGGGAGPPGPTVPPKLYTVYVGKNGNDGTADGSIGKPFLTVQAAMEFAWTTYVLPVEPQPVSPFRRPCVMVNAGTYDDGPLVLPPQICVMGEGYNHTRIVGDWTIDARWSNAINASDFRSSWINAGLFGAVTIDFGGAIASNEGKLYAFGVRFGGVVTITEKIANPVSNQMIFTDVEFLADVTLNGIATILQNPLTLGGTLTLNQLIGTSVDNTFQSSGGSLGNIVVNSLDGVSPPYVCKFGHAMQPGATLTLNGAFSTISAALDAVPLQSLVTLAGGAGLNQIFRINQLNWSGITANTPPTPYTGQQYFDTTIGKPVWWNGAAWISWLAGSVTSQWTAIVDPALGNDATGTFGSLELAFKTIQAAISAVPTPIDAATARTAWTILVSPGTYDEDLAVDLTHGKKIVLASWGPWNLGLFNAANWQPSNERSITITTSDAVTFDSINPSFAIQPMLPAGSSDITDLAQTAGPRISGQIDLTGVFAGTPAIDLTIQAEVFGVAVSSTSINAAAAIVRLYANRARMRRAVQGSGVRLRADESVFNGLLDIQFSSGMSECEVIGGMTVTSGSGPFYDCLLAGVYTGGGVFTFDYVTDHAFKTYGSSFAGGAFRVLIETANVSALPEQWAVNNVPAAVVVAAPMSAQVSTNFDDIRMIRSGWLVGIGARVTEPITAGTLTVRATINGAPVPALFVTNPPGQLVLAINDVPYVAGDLIGIQYETDVAFLPITTDVEAWLEVVEETP